jgi:hypothetical protein
VIHPPAPDSADIDLADLPAGHPALKIYGPGSAAPVYLVPRPADVPALLILGVPRGQVFTPLELLEVFLTGSRARGGSNGRG